MFLSEMCACVYCSFFTGGKQNVVQSLQEKGRICCDSRRGKFHHQLWLRVRFLCSTQFSFVSQMPPNIRKMFESPLSLGQQIVDIHTYQQRHRALIENRVVIFFQFENNFLTDLRVFFPNLSFFI